MVLLKPTEKIKRPVRCDDWTDLGAPTPTLIERAIDEGRLEEAKQMASYIVPEGKSLHDLFCDWIWNLYTHVAESYGEEAVYKASRATQGSWMMKRTYKTFSKMKVEDQIYLTMEIMRSHRGGSKQLGETPVIEEDDRYVLVFDPCGSGGRMRRGDPVDGTPPRTGPPYNFGVTQKPYFWSFGQKGVPYYCVHCCLNEILPMEWGGYPLWVTLYDPDPHKPCGWAFYKKPELIPEEFFARAGRKKPNQHA